MHANEYRAHAAGAPIGLIDPSLFPPAAVPASAPKRERAERGICDGFYRARDVSRPPVRESPAMTASSKVRNICLSQLVLSPTNVRKTPATEAEDVALEASI